MEAYVLALMRHPDRGTLQLTSDFCAGLAAGAAAPRLATLWQLAAAFFEAQSRGLLASDVYTKRIASRLLAQLRATVRGSDELSDRLAQDLLFFCAHAKAPSGAQSAPRLAAVRLGWNIGIGDDSAAVDYETPRLGRFDPSWIAQAKKRVSTAKESWSAVAGGELHRLTGLGEQFALVGDSLQRLFPSGEVLAGALQTAVTQTVAAGIAPVAPLAMEVATSILYLDASLEDGELDHPGLAARVQRLAHRIDDVRIGAEPQPLEGWMEELYRRVSDRQTMGSVVQELRTSLSEIEKQIDAYFRDPAHREVLIPVPGQLQSMRGVLSVLGLDQASQAVLHMRDDVDALAQTEVDPQRAIQAGTFDRLADNLGALSFLIDMLSVQPALAKSLFRFDPAAGSLTAVMGQSEKPSAFAAFDTTVSSGVDTVSTPTSPATLPAPYDTVQTVRDERDAEPATISGFAPLAPPLPPAPKPAPAPAVTSGLEDDAEMREIFIEEAREVVAAARGSLEKLVDQPDDLAEMTAVRRAFHTLKGSSRMVGLRDYGEAAWSCEQLYNARLAQLSRMDAGLRTFTVEALDYLAEWTEAIAAGRSGGHEAAAVARAADALRIDGHRMPIAAAAPALPAAAVQPEQEPTTIALKRDEFLAEAFAAPEPELPARLPEAVIEPEPIAARVPDLPSAADLDLSTPETAAPAPDALDFQFDLDTSEPAPPPLPEIALELPPPPPAPAAPLPQPEIETIELDLSAFDTAVLPPVERPPAEEAVAEVPPSEALVDLPLDAPHEPLPAEPVVAEAALPEPALEPALEDDEQVKVIGPLRISIPLFNIFLNEADELSRRLGTELAEWGVEYERHPVPESTVGLAHQLAGNSATVGYADLSTLARALEHALMRAHAVGRGRTGEPELFNDAAEEVRRLLHQFAAGFLRPVAPELIERLSDHERWPVPAPLTDFTTLEEAADEAPPKLATGFGAPDFGDDAEIDAVDAVDAELFPIFEEEADELLPQLQARLREWAARPDDRAAASACMRTLHTFKGGARLAGAMRVGEMAHRLETAIEHLVARERADHDEIDRLIGRADGMAVAFEALRRPAAVPQPLPVIAPPPEPARAAEPVAEAPAVAEAPPPAAAAQPLAPLPAAIDWTRFALGSAAAAMPAAGERAAPGAAAVVRVRGGLLDRLVNHAGEVSITRARLDADVRQLQGSLNELTDSLDRLRRQLRDIELQAETQLASRMEAAKHAAASFDPLEMDRFTRFQELTRFMAESVNDVATLQRSLQRTLQSTEDELAAQARLTRELQDDLLRTRMIEFESMADRLYRVVRQAAKDSGKQVRLDIVGGAIEVDRGVLERMTGPFEHLLRNSVVHGIELPDTRAAAGKDRSGSITITITQEGNEVGVEVRDDGGGLDMARIRRRGVERGLIAVDAETSDAELAQLIFAPGFSTADTVTELAGRGVGMDVVRAEVNAMGGRIQTASTPGRGTSFKLLLPLTTAVTQVVMLRCGDLHVAVPSTLVEIVRRAKGDEITRAYATGGYEFAGEIVPFYWLAALLQAGTRGATGGRSQPVVVIRSAAQRVALHVDEVVGNQEVVVKNVGPQLARLPGLAGVTLLPSGQVALIYNPVALATLYGPSARERMVAPPVPPQAAAVPVEPVAAGAAAPRLAPMVLVVDDSLTVRRVTQRLLVREGYRVATAKDGLDAIERLAEERPAVLLSDIEMPRMDGFDLVRNVRADPRLAELPVVMITSRIAQKHRDYAAQLGVDHYLGKPYSEEELLSLVARYAGADIPT